MPGKFESYEESIFFDKKWEMIITEKARRACEVGKKLGLIGKVADETLINKMEQLEKKDIAEANKGKKKANSSVRKFTQ